MPFPVKITYAKTMARKKIENLSFEESLAELETIVQHLEQGELDLEEAMSLFERGLHLSKYSQNKLQNAEQQINILLNKNGNEQLTPFTVNNNEINPSD